MTEWRVARRGRAFAPSDRAFGRLPDISAEPGKHLARARIKVPLHLDTVEKHVFDAKIEFCHVMWEAVPRRVEGLYAVWISLPVGLK